MADSDFEGLPTGSPLGTDIIASQVPGGATQQYTLDEVSVYRSAIGEMHSNADYTQTNIDTAGVKLNGYDASLTAVGITTTLTSTDTSNTGEFTINKDGTYRVTFNIEVGNTSNDNFDFVLRLNGVATPFKASIDMRNSAIDSGSAGLNTFLAIVDTDTIEIYVNHDGAGTESLLVDSLTFTAERVAN